MPDHDIELTYLAPSTMAPGSPPVVNFAVFWRDKFLDRKGVTFSEFIRHIRETGFRLENERVWISPTAILNISDVAK